jgi:hypothetical protein
LQTSHQNKQKHKIRRILPLLRHTHLRRTIINSVDILPLNLFTTKGERIVCNKNWLCDANLPPKFAVLLLDTVFLLFFHRIKKRTIFKRFQSYLQVLNYGKPFVAIIKTIL